VTHGEIQAAADAKRPPQPAAHAALADLLAAQLADAPAAAAWQLIEPARSVLLLAHEHPDPDTLGSALGLAHALAPLGKRCVVACADPVPAQYHAFLPGWELVVTELADERYDLVVALDAGELSRFGALYDRHRAFLDAAVILDLDHHITSAGCGQVNVIDADSAATAELVTLLLLKWRAPIGLDAARCLLAGVITDTRAFEFDATTVRTLEVGAYLVGCGAVPQDIIRPVYRLKPLAKVRLWGLTLQTVQSAAEGQVVWAALRQAHLVAAGATEDMDDGMPSYLIDIEGAKIAALFKEHRDGTTRVSLRTVAPFDAAAIAAQYGGGGHVRAAGCSLALPIDAAMAELVPYLEAVVRGADR